MGNHNSKIWSKSNKNWIKSNLFRLVSKNFTGDQKNKRMIMISCLITRRNLEKEVWRVNQKMVSIVSFLFGGDFSTICFCMSMNVEPLLANNLRRLITESSLKPATARSACPRSYLHFPMSVNLWTHGFDIFFKLYPMPLWNGKWFLFLATFVGTHLRSRIHCTCIHRKILLNYNYNWLEEELYNNSFHGYRLLQNAINDCN